MLSDERLREIRLLTKMAEVKIMAIRPAEWLDAVVELLAENERLRDQLRARRAEDDTKEVPV